MIIISPCAKQMRNGKQHPKNYPFWKDVIEKLDHDIIQIGTTGEVQLVEQFLVDAPLQRLANLVKQCDTWIAVDSFFPHFCWDLKKPGVVLFGQSDPLIFGHPENTNLLKSRNYLREKQFWLWEQAEANDECWVSPEEVVRVVTSRL